MIVDESESGADSSEMEKLADRYASHIVLGGVDPVRLSGADFRDLALNAYTLQQQTGAEAGALIFHWARRNGDNFTVANLAVKALYQAKGARQSMAKFVAENVNTEVASETDRALLSLVTGDSTTPAASD